MNKHFIIIFLLVIAFVFLTVACERDDICPDATPTTPLLIIEFFNVEEPEVNKSVQEFSYIPENATDTVFFNTTDSIAIPLNTNQNITEIQFLSNTNTPEFFNTDTVQFIYDVEDIYVNRACGFKAVYQNLSAIRTIENPASNNWIRSVIVEQLNVEDEQSTHVIILH